MSEFTVRIRTGEDCLAGSDCGRELARLLREVAARIEREQCVGLIVDINGNRVGTFGFTKRVRR